VLFLDTYRRPDGNCWTGQKLDEAAGGVVIRSYVTNLRKGRIDHPGYEKMLAIARAMGFPLALWFEDAPGDSIQAAPAEGQDLAGRVGHLFETIRHPATGEPYTNAEVARMSAGDLTEEEVEGMRIGKISDPAVSQVAALAAVFGVPTSYLVGRDKGQPVLDEETLGALADETAAAILRDSARLPDREKRIVLGIVREFGETT
jgi:transcriptional regulator with XRE-family HTH domain